METGISLSQMERPSPGSEAAIRDYLVHLRERRSAFLAENGFLQDGKNVSLGQDVERERVAADDQLSSREDLPEGFQFPWIPWGNLSQVPLDRIGAFRNWMVEEASIVQSHGVLWPDTPEDSFPVPIGDFLQTDALFNLPSTMLASSPAFGGVSRDLILARAEFLQQLKFEFLEQYSLTRSEHSFLGDIGRFEVDEPVPPDLIPVISWMRKDLEEEKRRLREGYVFAIAEALGAETVPEVALAAPR